MSSNPSLINGKDLLRIAGKLPWSPNTKVVLAGGCFDILHLGHVRFLEHAKKMGDVLVVALEDDTFIRNKKKREPFHTQSQRAEVLMALRSVDYVIALPPMQSDDDYHTLVTTVKPNTIAITKGDPHEDLKQKHAEAIDAEVVVVSNVVEKLSSSHIHTYARILHD